MKKLIFITVVSMFTFTFSNAQDVHFGAKVGLNLASITGDGTDGLSTLTSFHVGAMAEISLSETFSVQPELLYSGQGTDYEESDFSTTNLNYFNLPILAKYYFAEGFSLEAGPQIGFLLSANDDDLGGDISDSFNTIDFGLGLGAGYKLENGLNFAVHYNLGLSNVNDFDEAPSNQNGVIQISLGYFFN